MTIIKSPEEVLREARKASGKGSATQQLKSTVRPPVAPPVAIMPGATLEQRVKADFRVFLTLVWRHLLGVDPSPIQLDMAYWLQHGPDRSIIMAFRGFSKSWITGAYALWRLYCDPEEKVMIVSGGLTRAQATSNWCLSLVMTMPILKELRPKSNDRQSATMWDVGCCHPAQSASFTAFGIGGQLVGFRGSLIIPDDVETQTNSLTVVMRDKIREAVKEFESVLTPGGQIKYLGTPHDVESLYLYLLSLKQDDGAPVYEARIWCAHFPTAEQTRKYRGRLAPYLLSEIKRLGPACIGHSTMPNRFSDTDLAKRKAAMGSSEYQLQFMLDLTGSFIDKYPLRLKDLITMDLEDSKGPEDLAWGTTAPDRDLPVMGFDGDFYMKPVHIGDHYSKWDSVKAFIDPSGRGANQTAMAVGGLLNGRLFLLRALSTTAGYTHETLRAIADACVRYRVMELHVEGNFGDGMFLALLSPVVIKAWQEYNDSHPTKDHGGTEIIEIRSGSTAKEQRILHVLEPVVQAHRLVVSREVILADYRSLASVDGSDNAKHYSLAYQYTHLTREAGSLKEDDQIETLAGLVACFAADLGVDPGDITRRKSTERAEDLEAELLREDDEAVGRAADGHRDGRMEASRPQKR